MEHLIEGSPMTLSVPVRTLTLASRAPVWSKGGTNPGASEIFVLSGDNIMQIAPLVRQLRVTMIVTNPTNAFVCRPVLQATDDGTTWGESQNLDTEKTGAGTWTSSWFTDATQLRRGLRIGVIASQGGTSTTVEQARVSLIVDIELKS